MNENQNKNLENKKIIYVYDVLCPWCYAFTPIVQKLFQTYKDTFQFEVISGGLIQEAGSIESIRKKRTVSRESYKNIIDQTGAAFSNEFFTMVKADDVIMDSLIPATAVAIMRESSSPFHPIEFVSELFTLIYMKGYNPSSDKLYRVLAEKFQLNQETFIEQMKEEHFKQIARYDFSLAKQLKADAFPRLYLQESDTLFHLISKGFSEYETITDIIKDIRNS
ncbi:DsbA family protein [Bacillus horti]|uniref:DSBA-like thioredoxin domain-containing protein n=1 Tax=Caldalkalibacillus horti TaxID=77523 RepID=A0ABT9VYH1_9BACI|nr:DsbA family protein [Bacillus horti]MDQ0165872.1 putative protein-disulfide isomerase [Bacillus horti]